MPAPKGARPPAAGRGRPKGARNKINRDVREMILAALQAKGGQAYFERAADENMAAFLALIGKVLPMQVTGNDGGPIQIIRVRWANEGEG